jgi:putative two-component system response regulator
MTGIPAKKRILLIDDDEIQLSLITSMLQNEYEMSSVRSGEEALKYLYRGSIPHLILLDILMPEMDGWEVFNRIRAISLLRNVPIVFLTALRGTNDQQRARGMGAAGYIMKPYNKTELLEQIKTILEKYQKN